MDQFGRVFEAAFATTENGHLLSGPMKRLLGLLLQVLWSQQVNHFDFQFKKFYHLVYSLRFSGGVSKRNFKC